MMSQEKQTIKNCFWIFLFLLMTEGVFRRWLFPSLNNLFLVARDPFVIYAIFVGYRVGLLRDIPALLMVGLSILCFISAILFGHGNAFVALYGARILLHYPFIYICARVLSRKDILKVGRIFVLLITPMTLLCMVQFISPQSSLVNIGVGGDESGAGFSGGALGYYRPPGIFTFIAALTDYYGISLSFLLHFITNKKDAHTMHLNKTIIILSIIFYIISIPISISRTHLVQTIIICSFYIFMSLYDARKAQRVLLSLCLVFLAMLVVIICVPDIDLYLNVFSDRFSSANKAEGGFLSSAYERTFGWASRAFSKTSIMGYGDGYFTNVGMKILHGDPSNYSGEIKKIADSTEMEWGRVLCEDGIIFGTCILLLRFFISFDLFIKAKENLKCNGDTLSWLLLPFAIYLQLFGQLKAAYHLGFCTIITISCLTALRDNRKKHIIKKFMRYFVKNTI